MKFLSAKMNRTMPLIAALLSALIVSGCGGGAV